MSFKNHIQIFLFILWMIQSVSAQVKLPRLISDGMVLQRETEVKIWGWASANEQVTLKFLEGTYQAIADEADRWEVKLPPIEAGGPYKKAFISGFDSNFYT